VAAGREQLASTFFCCFDFFYFFFGEEAEGCGLNMEEGDRKRRRSFCPVWRSKPWRREGRRNP